MFELRCMSDGPLFKRTFAVKGAGTTVGRAEDNEVCVPDDSISSYHAAFLLDENGHLCVRDQGSTNGTRVNRNEITEARLQNGDELEFGNIVFRVAGLLARPSPTPADTPIPSTTNPVATTHPVADANRIAAALTPSVSDAPPTVSEVPSIERIAPREPLRLAQRGPTNASSEDPFPEPPLNTATSPEPSPASTPASTPLNTPSALPPSGFHWTSPSIGWTIAALTSIGILVLLIATYIFKVMHAGR